MTIDEIGTGWFCFLGEYKRKVDGRRRLCIPSEWRECTQFILRMPEKHSYLQLIPSITFKNAISVNVKSSKERDVIMASMGMRDCVIHCDGRLTIPSSLFDRIENSDSVVLSGSLWFICIWNPKAHDEDSRKNEESMKALLASIRN